MYHLPSLRLALGKQIALAHPEFLVYRESLQTANCCRNSGYTSWTCPGPDKQVLPRGESEGHACRARRSGMDHPTWCNGRDERVPPRGGRDTLFLLPKPRAESNLDFLHFAPGESVK